MGLERLLAPSPLKKIDGHPDLLPGEQVLGALFYVGGKMLAAADTAAARMTPGVSDDMARVGPYQRELRQVETEGAGSAAVDEFRRARGGSNGYLALTDHRLVAGRTATNWKRPDKLDGAIDLEEVDEVSYDRPHLVVRFRDGSVLGFHTTKVQQPERFVEAFRTRTRA